MMVRSGCCFTVSFIIRCQSYESFSLKNHPAGKRPAGWLRHRLKCKRGYDVAVVRYRALTQVRSPELVLLKSLQVVDLQGSRSAQHAFPCCAHFLFPVFELVIAGFFPGGYTGSYLQGTQTTWFHFKPFGFGV